MSWLAKVVSHHLQFNMQHEGLVIAVDVADQMLKEAVLTNS